MEPQKLSIIKISYLTPHTVSSEPRPTAATALELTAADMREVDRVIAARLDTDVPLVAQVCRHILSAGGKRLRPVLLLLTSQALNSSNEQRYNLAAIVEFIHTATLLHDDVVDESMMRRGRATANASFGNPASVLVGDFLYSRAFQMMVDANNLRIMQVLAEATNVIAEGEVLQLMNMHDATLDEETYLKVIRSKTAKLFEASTRLAAILVKAETTVEEACATYGQALGTAFQVIDDVLDYEGDPQVMGKNLGDDLAEGKVTLPLIIASRRANSKQKALIREAIEKGSVDFLPAITQIITETNALDASRQTARAEVGRAINAAQQLPESPARNALIQLASDLTVRLH
jgi:octaprenyl-diphosphate synthase